MTWQVVEDDTQTWAIVARQEAETYTNPGYANDGYIDSNDDYTDINRDTQTWL